MVIITCHHGNSTLCVYRDNWQLMVTEEIKMHFRKANRQVDKNN